MIEIFLLPEFPLSLDASLTRVFWGRKLHLWQLSFLGPVPNFGLTYKSVFSQRSRTLWEPAQFSKAVLFVADAGAWTLRGKQEGKMDVK